MPLLVFDHDWKKKNKAVEEGGRRQGHQREQRGKGGESHLSTGGIKKKDIPVWVSHAAMFVKL